MNNDDNDLLPPSGDPYWSADRNSPEHKAAVARVAAKFDTRHSGTPADAADAPPTSGYARQAAWHRAAAGSPADAAAGDDPDISDLWAALSSRDHPQHLEALAEKKRRFDAAYPEKRPEGEAAALAADPELRVYDARQRAGTHEPDLPEPLRGQWDISAESDVLTYATREGINAGTLQDIVDWYASHVPTLGLDGAAEAFESRFARELTPQQLQKLVAWGRAWHGLDG